MFVAIFVFSPVEVSAMNCSLVEGSPKERGASLCVIYKPNE